MNSMPSQSPEKLFGFQFLIRFPNHNDPYSLYFTNQYVGQLHYICVTGLDKNNLLTVFSFNNHFWNLFIMFPAQIIIICSIENEELLTSCIKSLSVGDTLE